jgi:cytochrome c-type biogenesis protein CcmH
VAYYSKMATGMKQWLYGSVFFIITWCSHIALVNAETRDTYTFASSDAQNKFDKLTHHFRCLVCQNQSLADSNAELAVDLRQQIYEMVNKNQSEQIIIDFMIKRYGDFVLYEPPLRLDTYLLWFGPFILLMCGFMVLALVIHKRKAFSSSIKNFDELLTKQNQSSL